MKTKWLFSLAYLRGQAKKRKTFTEYIVAESVKQALEYWGLELLDENVEILKLERHVPVLSIEGRKP